MPIQSAQFLISFPQASWPWKNEDRFVYYGDYGSRSLVQNVILTDNILSGVLDASLQPRQAVTV